MQHWFILAAAILFEVAATTSMKLSAGFTKLTPSVAMVVLYLASFTALTFAIKKIDISVAYALWSGFGTAAIAVIGVLLFKEGVNPLKLASIALIIIGVVGLNLSGAGHSTQPEPPASPASPASTRSTT